MKNWDEENLRKLEKKGLVSNRKSIKKPEKKSVEKLSKKIYYNVNQLIKPQP